MKLNRRELAQAALALQTGARPPLRTGRFWSVRPGT